MLQTNSNNAQALSIPGLVDSVVEDLSTHPVGAWTGSEKEKRIEQSYLATLRDSYVRTVADVHGYFARRGATPSAVRIIEFGQYLGVVSRCLARLGYQVTGSDYPPLLASERLRNSFEGSGISLHPQDLARPMSSLADETFDGVICCETIEHLNFNPVPVIDEMNRILKLGGMFYFAVPNAAHLRSRLRLLFGKSIHNPVADFFEQLQPQSVMGVGIHWREYTREEVEQLLTAMGFSLRECKYSDLHGPATRSGLARAAKSTVTAVFPSLAASVVVTAEKAARSNPLRPVGVGEGTAEVAAKESGPAR